MNAYVVETTAAGTAAIAVLEVVGPEASEAVYRAFGISTLLPGRLLRGTISSGDEELDDVLLRLRGAEESMTGWPHVEVQCHGSPAVVTRIRRALAEAGAKPAPRTFLLRAAVRNRRMTRLEEEAWLCAMSAATERAATELFEQRKALPALAGRIGDTRDRSLVLQLIATGLYGNRLACPAVIPVLGRPNSGKSTLINALAERERVLVDPKPGTTRDLVRVQVAMEGIPFVLVDTPGIRETRDPVERDGMQQALRLAKRNTLALHLVDPADAVIQGPDLPGFRVWTKCDLRAERSRSEPGMRVSAVTGEGLDSLRTEILYIAKAAPKHLVEGAFLFTARQVRRATELLDATDSRWVACWERWVWGRARQ